MEETAYIALGAIATTVRAPKSNTLVFATLAANTQSSATECKALGTSAATAGKRFLRRLKQQDMMIDDLPRAVLVSDYEATIRLYSMKVRSRATAVYQVGRVRFPSLSDIDLIVVVNRSLPDNNQFYSISTRLPHRQRRLFLHDVFILPHDLLEVIRHTSHNRRRLILGSDVLEQLSQNKRVEERWCKLLESYCNYVVFCARVSRQDVSGRLVVAVANSLRYGLEDLDMVFHTDEAEPYGAYIDQLRNDILVDPNRTDQIFQAVWTRFNNGVETIENCLRQEFGIRDRGALLERAKAMLGGSTTISGLDQNYIFNRKALIGRYYSELRRLRLSFGSLFYFAAYESAQTCPYRQPALAKAAGKIRYVFDWAR